MAFEAEDRHYWPSSALDEFEQEECDEILVGFEDEEVALQLLNMIQQQNAVLKQAKERLRDLLKQKFSIEEILFQSDSHPYL
jgi:hypothetical protein